MAEVLVMVEEEDGAEDLGMVGDLDAVMVVEVGEIQILSALGIQIVLADGGDSRGIIGQT
jgi:hypothetical protein